MMSIDVVPEQSLQIRANLKTRPTGQQLSSDRRLEPLR